MENLLQFLSDPQERSKLMRNALAAITRGGVAGTLGAPVDMINLGLNAAKAGVGYVGHKTGLLSADQMPQIDEQPVGGSEWIGNKLQKMGLLSDYRNPTAEMVAGGLLAPLTSAATAARAPQIARGLLAMEANAQAPKTLNAATNNQAGAIVWHGSPHKFDKFDATRAGQEGGTSFGMGHNFSADTKHAEIYAKREGAGNLYKVDIPDDAISSMLKWEKPLDQQPPAARELASTVAGALPERLPFGGGSFINTKDGGVRLEFPDGGGFNLSQSDYQRMFGDAGTGEQIYRRLIAKLGDEKAANEALRRAGVRGIENNVERGAKNFVVFPGEENLLQILERNGQPLK